MFLHIFLIFQEETFWASKIKIPTFKNFLIFREVELSIAKLKKLFIFQEGSLKSQALNKILI